MKKISNYDIGIDIGTNSVGYSVTDECGKLLKFKGQNMWGVNLFDEGQSAAKRRVARSTRRRYDRRKNRINLLQNMLCDDVFKVDENFFLRLKESALWNEDKSASIKNDVYTIFCGKDFSEKDYYKQYPTIYHLRKHLCLSDKKEDIRLVYLAMHHIVKYRGNFLYEDDNNISAKNSEVKPAVIELKDAMSEYFGEQLFSADEVSSIIADNKKRKFDKESELPDAFCADKDTKKRYTNISKALLGNKADFKAIFDIDTENKISYYISDEDIDDKLEEYLDEEQLVVFEAMKKVYSAFILGEILKGDNIECLSDAMIAKYNKHKDDLKLLKKLIKDNFSKEDYEQMFKSVVKANENNDKDKEDSSKKTKPANYAAYISGYDNQKPCPKEDFYAYLTSFFKECPDYVKDNSDYKYIIKEIDDGTFMPKINSKENGAIPYQLHLEELKRIIENQGKYYPDLIENEEKILSLVTFRVPYYVGPLNEKRNPSDKQTQFAWMVRKEEGKIYPWNFEEKVDIDSSADRFIERMRNKCTYLPNEDVIPKQSLLYSEFEVLNEIKQIKTNGEFLDSSFQKMLHNEVFTVKKSVTEATLRKWLIEKKYKDANNCEITGFQKEGKFASSLASYIDFKNIFPDFSRHIEQTEKIIYWITVFEDKKILRRKLKNDMPDLTESQCDKICKLNYSGWSRLSRKLLTGIHSFDNNGKRRTIIGAMRNSTKNFMQIINDKELGFKELIEKEACPDKLEKITDEVIDSLAGSPAIKRGIKQSVDVVAEIIKIVGCEPRNIYIEFAREEGKKERKISRYNQLTKTYDELKKNPEFSSIIKELKEIDDKKLDDKMVYLYFLQNGKSMYSGKPLSLNNLSQTCQIDHIIPQSYIKDDSIDNTVLVLSGENQLKGDNLLIDSSVRSCYKEMWKSLYDKKLISSKKYFNLIRGHFIENDLKGFINRQLVETRQITKNVAALFTAVYKDTKIVQIKAQLSSDLRKKEGLYKCRDLNDFHHAHDAFIAATLGRYISTCFPKLNDEFDYNSYRKYIKSVKSNKDLKKQEFGYIINCFRNIETDLKTGEVVWDGAFEIERLRKCLNYNDCFISRKLEEQTAEFYKETLLPKTDKKDSKLIPKKAGLPVSKYGGYTSPVQAYYAIVEFDGKKSREKKLVGITVQVAHNLLKNKNAVIEYLENSGYKNARILKDRILKYQKIIYKGDELYIVSSTEVCNARQLILPADCSRIISNMNNKKFEADVTEENLVKLYEILVEKILSLYHCFNSIGEKLKSATPNFESLEKQDKINVINQILVMLHANSSNADFGKYSLSGLKSRCGRMGGTNLDVDKITFVNTSVTGMFK